MGSSLSSMLSRNTPTPAKTTSSTPSSLSHTHRSRLASLSWLSSLSSSWPPSPSIPIAADNWLHAQGYASPDQIAYGANAQTNWDPSVKALTAFPQVLDLMNRDLHWTTDLGNAYYNQPQDVLQTIQVMRQRAQDAGNLQNTPQEQVSYNQGYIQLAPANPQVVYVPAYNPWTAYGQPPAFAYAGKLRLQPRRRSPESRLRRRLRPAFAAELRLHPPSAGTNACAVLPPFRRLRQQLRLELAAGLRRASRNALWRPAKLARPGLQQSA